jgi:hypothetical protein
MSIKYHVQQPQKHQLSSPKPLVLDDNILDGSVTQSGGVVGVQRTSDANIGEVFGSQGDRVVLPKAVRILRSRGTAIDVKGHAAQIVSKDDDRGAHAKPLFDGGAGVIIFGFGGQNSIVRTDGDRVDVGHLEYV